MGEKTGITWTGRLLPDGTIEPGYTFNGWIGCTRVSQGCKLCYAETQNGRYNWNPEGWGVGKPRKRTSEAYWEKPISWAKKAVKDGVTRRVFCASLSDVFDPEVPEEWRYDLWKLIGETGKIGGLEWLILTKRPDYIENMLPFVWKYSPPDFVRLGVTVEDQDNIKRISKLLETWKGKNFISVEPMLGPVRLLGFGSPTWGRFPENAFIHWVICGGESGAGCREMDLSWARDLQAQCSAYHVPFFMKQLGGFPDKRHTPAEWPEDLRVQQFPEG